MTLYTMHLSLYNLSMQCLICDKEVKSWLSYGVPPKVGQCPHCGGKARHREMAYFFLQYFPRDKQQRILEIGPSKVTTHRLVNPRFLGKAHYTAVDIRPLKHHEVLQFPYEFVQMDATQMNFADRSFDLVICNHVLPYIPDDKAVLHEIGRVLKDEGIAILNSHVEKRPRTLDFTDLKKLDPQKYSEEYGHENGTAREYGLDYEDRLRECGFAVERLDLFKNKSSDFLQENGLKTETYLTIGFRSQCAREYFLQKHQ